MTHNDTALVLIMSGVAFMITGVLGSVNDRTSDFPNDWVYYGYSVPFAIGCTLFFMGCLS